MCDTYTLELKNPSKTNLSSYLLLNNKHNNKYQSIPLVLLFLCTTIPVVITLSTSYSHGLKHKVYNSDIKKELFGDCDNSNHSSLGKKKCTELKGLNS